MQEVFKHRKTFFTKKMKADWRTLYQAHCLAYSLITKPYLARATYFDGSFAIKTIEQAEKLFIRQYLDDQIEVDFENRSWKYK